MDLKFTEEQIAVKKAARDFAEKELLPGVIERDEKQLFPSEQIKKLGNLGFMGMMTDPKYGGSGMDTVSYVLVMEEISKIDASTAVCLSVNNSLVCFGLEKYGSEEQKQEYLVPLAQGKKIGAFCLSEPEAGSDASALNTTAIEKEDHYLLNGTKNWITNGNSASIYLVLAQTEPEKKHKGINIFIIERDMEGFIIGKKENKLGIRASDTHSLMFQNVKIPKKNKIGKNGFGFNFAMDTLNGGRIGIASQALGIASGALNLSMNYAKERKTFGVEIGKHQAIQFKIADMATHIEAARLLCINAALKRDTEENYAIEASMAKLFASEVAMNSAIEAVQIHGGYGYVKEYHVERLMRDAKITQIYEGTSEIQRIIISKSILK